MSVLLAGGYALETLAEPLVIHRREAGSRLRDSVSRLFEADASPPPLGVEGHWLGRGAEVLKRRDEPLWRLDVGKMTDAVEYCEGAVGQQLVRGPGVRDRDDWIL